MVEGEQYWFESVPEEDRYWTVAQLGMPQSREGANLEAGEEVSIYASEAGDEEIEEIMRRQFEVSFVPAAFEPELIQTEPDAKYGLVLYTTREAAEEVLRDLEERDPEEYLRMVGVYGQEQTDQAYSNSAPYEVAWTTASLLLEKLKEVVLADLEGYAPPFAVMVDGRLRDRWAFVQKLEQQAKGEE